MAKVRLDKHLTELYPELSRERVLALIMSGNVLVGNDKQDKPGTMISSDAPIRLLKTDLLYVSRGGEKLAGAINTFGVNVSDRCCLDVGISTGGFTDFLLKSGAKMVVGVDVGYGQLDYRLRQDPRVFLVERTNARYLTPGILKETLPKSMDVDTLINELNIVVMDVSFISVSKVLPAIRACVTKFTQYVILIKPQFEAERDQIGKGGIIKDPQIHDEILSSLTEKLSSLSFKVVNSCPSPILGTKGNREFFFHLEDLS